jgi:hypothetical protein
MWNQTDSQKLTGLEGAALLVESIVSPSPPPVFLGTYPNATVLAGQNTTVTPSVAPTGATSLNAFADNGFSGVLTVNPTTGLVTITNAMQKGVYGITVTAPNGTATANFTLFVTKPDCATQYVDSVFVVGYQLHAPAIADFNDDGMQDFATTITEPDRISMHLGNGTGGFTSAPKLISEIRFKLMTRVKLNGVVTQTHVGGNLPHHSR